MPPHSPEGKGLFLSIGVLKITSHLGYLLLLRIAAHFLEIYALHFKIPFRSMGLSLQESVNAYPIPILLFLNPITITERFYEKFEEQTTMGIIPFAWRPKPQFWYIIIPTVVDKFKILPLRSHQSVDRSNSTCHRLHASPLGCRHHSAYSPLFLLFPNHLIGNCSLECTEENWSSKKGFS